MEDVYTIANLDKLLTYAGTVIAQPQAVKSLRVSAVAGGYSLARLFRWDVDFALVDGSTGSLAFIQKFTHINEVRAMRTLAGFPGAAIVPALIDSAIDESQPDNLSAHWFVMPFYEGKSMTWDDEIPVDVVRGLALIHAHFADQTHMLDWLPRVDGTFIRQLFSGARHKLGGAGAHLPVDRLESQLQKAVDDGWLTAALDHLPHSLAQGDINPENIITLSDGRSVLLDWGNAKRAPVMFDLANLVDLDSENWRVYLDAWTAASGSAMPDQIARLGYHWATAMINAMYLPFAIEHSSPEHVDEMVGKISAAVEKVAGLQP